MPKELIPIEQIKKEIKDAVKSGHKHYSPPQPDYWVYPKSYHDINKDVDFISDLYKSGDPAKAGGLGFGYAGMLLKTAHFLFKYMNINTAWMHKVGGHSEYWTEEESMEYNEDVYEFVNIFYWLNKYSEYNFLQSFEHEQTLLYDSALKLGKDIYYTYDKESSLYLTTNWNMPIELVNDLGIHSTKGVEHPECLDIDIQFKTIVNKQDKEEPYVASTSSVKYVTSHRSAVNPHNPFELESRSWNLDQQASDYYLLHLLDIAGDETYVNSGNGKQLLKHVTDKLDNQFRRYTDMVIGGELRHLDLDSYGNQLLTKEMLPMYNMMRDSTLLHDTTSRNQAWVGWYYIRQEYGTLALRWADKLFRDGNWQTNYGGDAWSKITQVLLHREVDKITAHTFIDSCWGLHHNTGSYFNKWWETTYLMDTLNDNLNGKYCVLKDRASSYIQDLVDRYISNIEVCQCTYCDDLRSQHERRIKEIQNVVNILHNHTEGERIYA